MKWWLSWDVIKRTNWEHKKQIKTDQEEKGPHSFASKQSSPRDKPATNTHTHTHAHTDACMQMSDRQRVQWCRETDGQQHAGFPANDCHHMSQFKVS